jgi:hypothetical protein
MTRKLKCSSVVEIGTGPTRVKIYTVNRKDDYPMLPLCWKEDGQRKAPSLPAWRKPVRTQLIAQPSTSRLTNGWSANAG